MFILESKDKDAVEFLPQYMSNETSIHFSLLHILPIPSPFYHYFSLLKQLHNYSPGFFSCSLIPLSNAFLHSSVLFLFENLFVSLFQLKLLNDKDPKAIKYNIDNVYSKHFNFVLKKVPSVSDYSTLEFCIEVLCHLFLEMFLFNCFMENVRKLKFIFFKFLLSSSSQICLYVFLKY